MVEYANKQGDTFSTKFGAALWWRNRELQYEPKFPPI